MAAHRNITLSLAFAPGRNTGDAVIAATHRVPGRWRFNNHHGRVRAVMQVSVNHDSPELWDFLQAAKAVFEETPALHCTEARIDRSLVEHYK